MKTSKQQYVEVSDDSYVSLINAMKVEMYLDKKPLTI
jgi:hypothetical protein